jgi:hypothetical protein
MLPRADACIFCNRTPVVEEHIFSRKWLKRIWNLPKGHQLGHRHVRRDTAGQEEFDVIWSKQEASLVAYCVCAKCNSGWMNALDQHVYRIIDPLTRGENAEIKTLKDQTTLVHWAMKVALMFDWQQDASTVPAEIARNFHKDWTMPPDTYIWLARNIPFNRGHASGAFHTLARGDDPQVYLVTFRVDQMVVQVLLGIGFEIRPVRPRHGDAVRQVWPLTYERIVWPPPRTLDEVEYVAFTQDFVRDYLRG